MLSGVTMLDQCEIFIIYLAHMYSFQMALSHNITQVKALPCHARIWHTSILKVVYSMVGYLV